MGINDWRMAGATPKIRIRSAVGTIAAIALLAACASSPSVSSQAHSSALASAEQSAAVASSPSPGASQTPTQVDFRIVISDVAASEVRLARADATDTATVKGLYDGVVNGRVLVVNGTTLVALSRGGTPTTLGHLAATPDWVGPGTVVVNPQASEWVYATHDNASTATVHLGTPSSDKVVATIPSPDGNAYYQPFEWNASGIYMVRQPIGIGGAGPFLEYHFPLARFDLASGHVTDVAPSCIVFQVLDDGTMLCRTAAPGGNIEVRSPGGQSRLIQVGSGGSGTGASVVRVAVSRDGTRLVAGRNGSKDPVINYQMAIADLASSSSAATFGSLDYLPDGWLPDGRVIADHQCVLAEWGGGPCNAALDGTYFFSADGTSKSLFYKLTRGFVVGYV